MLMVSLLSSSTNFGPVSVSFFLASDCIFLSSLTQLREFMYSNRRTSVLMYWRSRKSLIFLQSLISLWIFSMLSVKSCEFKRVFISMKLSTVSIDSFRFIAILSNLSLFSSRSFWNLVIIVDSMHSLIAFSILPWIIFLMSSMSTLNRPM